MNYNNTIRIVEVLLLVEHTRQDTICSDYDCSIVTHNVSYTTYHIRSPQIFVS